MTYLCSEFVQKCQNSECGFILIINLKCESERIDKK